MLRRANSLTSDVSKDGSVFGEANSADQLREAYEAMAKRRYQKPKPKRHGNFWYLLTWEDEPDGTRKRKRYQLAEASMPLREVQKVADEILQPLNQNCISVGSAVNFMTYVKDTYIPTELPLLAKTTQDSYQGIIAKYLEPRLGALCLRQLTPFTLQRLFSSLAGEKVAHPSIVKIRDTLSSILRSAVRYGFLIQNPMTGLKLPVDKRPRRPKPTITPEQFNNLVEFIPEPYATMVFVAVWTGVRVSELLGLKWRCIHPDANAITIEERFCRGDWSVPKTQASAATIGVEPQVIKRILRLKILTVKVRAGCAMRRYKVVKSDGPDDLVFQSVKDGKPMRDGNILKRFVRPAAGKVGLRVNWRCLRTSYATWLVQAGADPKSVQGQMRHSRISTTMDIYAQIVPAAQRQALEKLSEFAKAKSVPVVFQ